MKSLIQKAFILTLVPMTFSCSTLYFHNGGKEMVQETEYSEWHHGGILRLVEFSAPVDLSARCEGKDWTVVKTEQTFIQGFVRAFADGIYDPWMAGYSCQK